MNENDDSTARGLDPDTAPDLSKDGWPEKFAKVPVRRGRARQGTFHRLSVKHLQRYVGE